MTRKIAGRCRAAALAVGMTGALATACGSGGTSKDVGLLTYTGADRQQKLEAAAKKEGRLTWYTSLAGQVDDQLVKGFEAKYPDIKVSLTRGAENDIATRIEQETQARKYRADVLEVTEPASMKLRQEKITAPFSSPEVTSIPASFKTAAGGDKVWDATDRISPISFGYNKTKIPANAVPHDLNGLLNPALNGKLAIESTTTGVRWIGSVLNELGEQRGEAFLKQLSANHVKVQAVSGAALMSLVSQGEVGASPSVFENHAQQQAAAHAPVAWTPIGSVVGNTGAVALVKSAPHPAAAMLFAEFLLSKDGAKLFDAAHYHAPTERFTYKVWVPELQYKTAQSYGAAFDKWHGLLQQDFGK